MGFLILQWNARSLTANGQDFKKFIVSRKKMPDIVCVQETWLKPHLNFTLPGYQSVRRDREQGHGGGVATFIRDGIGFRIILISREFESIVVEVWGKCGKIKVVNFYNPCKKLSMDILQKVAGPGQNRALWCGDFNSHSTLWGSSVTDYNGLAVEEYLEEEGLVCLNDGRATRFDLHNHSNSVIDLTLVSSDLAGKSYWNVLQSTSLGSDHYPIFCDIGAEMVTEQQGYRHRWNFNKADWKMFSALCDQRLEDWTMSENVDDCNKELCHILYKSAEESVPVKKYTGKKAAVPWWTSECSTAVRQRNKALRMVRKTLRSSDLIHYRQAQAIVRKTVKSAKRKYWRTFCSSIGTDIHVNEVWNMIRKMRGNRKSSTIPVLVQGVREAVLDVDKAELLAQAFVKSHSSDNLNNDMKVCRDRIISQHSGVLQKRMVFDNVLDNDLTLIELKQAIVRSGRTSPGKDKICYDMFKHLSDGSLEVILDFYNKIWTKGQLPSAWKLAIVVAIGKAGKELSDVAGYRPISLTSHICKLMERMITERLTYYIERQSSFSPYQSGFRKGRMTMDSVICLESEVRRAQRHREVVVAVLFDIEKAYDMLWKEGLLIKLDKIGIGGRLYNWVMNFLIDRSIQVRVGAAFSKEYRIENGTPQGSVCSPLLFNLMINDIFYEVGPDIGKSLYADDGALWKRGRNISFVTRKIQEAITAVEQWANMWGFKLSVPKTQVICFSKSPKTSELGLKMYGQALEQVKTVKFLGMWMDSRLTWRQHIVKMSDKCKKGLNVLKCLAGSDWGADRSSMLSIYDALIRSVFDYGCVAYRSAAVSNLKTLDVIQAQALRICCGAVRSSPVASLQVETGEMPLHLRRMALSMVYWANLKGHTESHPALASLHDCNEHLYGSSRSFGCVSNLEAGTMGLQDCVFCATVPRSVIPPWFFQISRVDLTLLDNSVDNSQRPIAPVRVEKHLVHNYHGCLQFYSDGSKDPTVGSTAAAVFIPEFQVLIRKRLSDNLSVFSTELVAILLALQWAEDVCPMRMVVCSDSLSALQCIQVGQSASRQDLILEISQTLFRLHMQMITVHFLWVPAHVGVEGNETADAAARQCLKRSRINLIIPLGKSEARMVVRQFVKKMWQTEWEQEHKGRHLFAIQPKVGTRGSGGYGRRQATVLTRLRLGHTMLNASLYLIQRHATGCCRHCQKSETVEHVLLSCKTYTAHRDNFFNTLKEIGHVDCSLKGLLSYGSGMDKVHKQAFIFLRSIGMYDVL